MLADLLAAVHMVDLPRAVILYPFNTVNLYHYASEALPMVHRTLC